MIVNILMKLIELLNLFIFNRLLSDMKRFEREALFKIHIHIHFKAN